MAMHLVIRIDMCRDGLVTSRCSVEEQFHGICHINSTEGAKSLTVRCPSGAFMGAPMVASYSGAVCKGQRLG